MTTSLLILSVCSAGSPSGAAYKQNYLKKDMLARAGEQYQNKSFTQDEVSLAGTRWVCLLSAHLYRRHSHDHSCNLPQSRRSVEKPLSEHQQITIGSYLLMRSCVWRVAGRMSLRMLALCLCVIFLLYFHVACWVFIPKVNIEIAQAAAPRQ